MGTTTRDRWKEVQGAFGVFVWLLIGVCLSLFALGDKLWVHLVFTVDHSEIFPQQAATDMNALEPFEPPKAVLLMKR